MSNDSRIRIKNIFSSDHFSDFAAPVVEQLKNYLNEAQTSNAALFHPVVPNKMADEARTFLESSPAKISALTAWFLQSSRLLHSPHYMGHQVPAPIPTSSLFAFMSALSNQGGAVFEMGPSLAAIERAVITKLLPLIGWDKNADGIVTNGGTLANLTALLTARNTHFKTSWKNGLQNLAGKMPVILTSSDSHYSIARAVGIIGLGTEQVIKIPLNNKHQVTGEALKNTLAACRQNNQEVFCVVASSCTTATGSFDRLKEIGKICNQEKIWLHIDGAHGASVLFSKKYKRLVEGIELADSITWDAHKMLFVHSLCTFVFYKNGRNSFETFQQDAPYLFTDAEIEESSYWDAGLRTLECTRQPLAVPLWGVWSLYGSQVFEDCLNISFENAKALHALIESHPDFVALHTPEANIQCFRYIPEQFKSKTQKEISDLQMQIKSQILKSGKFYITSTTIDGVTALRVTLMNPFIDSTHLKELLTTISACDLP